MERREHKSGGRTIMKRVISGAALALMMAVGVADATAQERYEWRMATVVPETTAFFTLFSEQFAKRAAELTDGRVAITPYAGGVLAPPFEAYDATVKGTADITHGFPAYLANQDPTNVLFAGHAGGMDAEGMLHWLYEGGGKELLEQFRRETQDLHPLIVGVGPTEVFAHSHKPIQTAADLSGIKFRTVGAWAQIIKDKFGGVPTTVPGSELYIMLDRKAIDATEWSTPAENLSMGFHNIAEYIIVPGMHQPAFMFDVVFRAEDWDALPDDLKARLEAAAKLTTFDTFLMWGASDLDAMDELRAGGNTVQELDPELKEAIREAGRTWVTETAARLEGEGNPWMKRVADSYYAFMDKWRSNGTYRVEGQ
jgi:TRAP-type mannitol/chloroaromatic compound transport system substrate-binding protein